MPKRGGNISLTSYDDIFETDESRAESQLERVQNISISELVPFKDHPFKVVDDEAMLRTTESIAQYGVLTPLIARPLENGGYEIISGHRRAHAAEMAGLTEVPVLVRQMDDDAATVLMVDSNLQRENILPSERAYAYKMKKDAMERTLGRPKKEGQVVSNYAGKKTSEVIAEGTGESYKQVERYIRLTNLIPELLEMVDQKQISFNPAVELSYLAPEEQEIFMQAMLHKAAKQAFDQLDGQKVPSRQALHEEFNRLLVEKKQAYAEYRQVKKEMQEYLIAKQTVEHILGIDRHKRVEEKKQQKEEQR